ncbi:hypothetical protein [Saccharothrix sp. NRRL B-16314]|uniref:hypothetical protein n=1 Tax=Saccharothrix sp. NRRL B-16314 TaxID=1463825 RepID=UPI00068A9A6D|nr:hypothetical protein [Saccharothrix sp. NRRL B-16314]
MKRVSAAWSRWPVWSGYAAALWSFVYGCLGLYWAVGGSGFPFGRGYDREADDVFSLLAGANPGVGGPVIAGLGLAGAVIGLLMAQGRGHGVLARLMLGFAGVTAATLALVIPDFRVLMLLTRLPFMPIWAFTGVPGGLTVGDLVPWARINLLVLVLGGLLWAMAALAYSRRIKQVCLHCGRGVHGARWTSPEAAGRWGRRAVAVATVVPLIYAATRIAWALGIPLGIPRSFYEENVDSGMFIGGLAIALMAIGGAVLTMGLVQRWGEVYPRWIWFKKGKRVPLALAMVPAGLVSVFVVPAGIMEIRMAFIRGIDPQEWAMLGPGLLWPLWGLALGAATVAYYLRRRGECPHCGLGAPSGPVVEAEVDDAVRS